MRMPFPGLILLATGFACIAASPASGPSTVQPPRAKVEIIHRDQLGVFRIDNGRTQVLATSFLIKPGEVGHHDLGPLLTFANDEIQPGSGFKLHPHDNVEVITIVLEGSLDQQDTAGHKGHVSVGEVALMSAGTGVKHSEVGSPDVLTRSITIWLKPRTMNKTPQYTVAKPVEHNGWKLIAAERNAPLIVDQDARVSMKRIAGHQSVRVVAHPGRLIYLGVVDGELVADKRHLMTPERLILHNGKLRITSGLGATVVIVDVPSDPR